MLPSVFGDRSVDVLPEPRRASRERGPAMPGLDRHGRTGNLFLDSMGSQDRNQLLSDSRARPIEVGTILFRPGDKITYVAFPTSGTLSMVTEPEGGRAVEAA